MYSWLYVKFDEKQWRIRRAHAIHRDPSCSSYTQISCKNLAQSYLNFDDRFEFGDLKNTHNHRMLQVERICEIWAGCCVFWVGYGYSVIILCDLSWFYVICDGSAWSVLVLCYLSWFFLICISSIWSVFVLRNQYWFRMICASSAKCVMDLCDLKLGCVICDGSTWSELVWHDLWWFCVACDCSAWSELVLRDL